MVNQVNASSGNRNAMSYSASGGGTSTVVVPLVMKNRDGWRGRIDWYTSLNVQNLGSASTTVRVDYYNTNGSWRTFETKQVPVQTNTVFYPAPGDSGIPAFLGSAAVTVTSQPIAVVVNHVTSSGGTEDTSMSHIGLNR
jgi:hypothetical protein